MKVVLMASVRLHAFHICGGWVVECPFLICTIDILDEVHPELVHGYVTASLLHSFNCLGFLGKCVVVSLWAHGCH